MKDAGLEMCRYWLQAKEGVIELNQAHLGDGAGKAATEPSSGMFSD
jgi:hypothetical protein